MERAIACRTSSRNSGGVIDWTAAKSIVVEFPVYPDGNVLSNLVLKTVPAMDCVLNREKRLYVIFKPSLTKPTVAPVKRRRKNALVPTAMSFDCNALVNTWYGACRSTPRPIPAMRGKSILVELLDRSSNVIIKPGRGTKKTRSKRRLK